MFGGKKKTESNLLDPIDEVRNAIFRMEKLVEQAKIAYAFASGGMTLKKKSRRAQKEKEHKIPDKKSASLNDEGPNGNTKRATFMPFDQSDEDELVELIRRTAELVVRGERFAAAWQSGNIDEDVDIDSHLAVFELFCEKNVLTLFVNILSGAIFSSDANNLLLPPLAIATQIVQSVAILVQNVSRATSLYFLLSNNHINEMIRLPIQLYAAAEGESLRSKKISLNRQHSAEIAELLTYFVSFLKGLTMRMNAETLQFFLSYKTETTLKSTASSPHFSSSSERTNDATNVEIENFGEDLLSKINLEVEFPLYARALQFCSEQDSFVRVTAMNICLNTIRLATVVTNSTIPSSLDNDDNPAMFFDHLSFISESKINVASENTPNQSHNNPEVQPNKDSAVDEKESEKLPSSSSLSDEISKLNYSSPEGTLVDVELPLRERIAIAHHVCTPSRVEELVAPIFIRLAHLCGNLEESIRSLENNELEHCQNQTNSTQYSDVRRKLRASIDDIVADLQDELMLLNDLLEVGLTSLNEQTVEMMLATFIYPSLLQPLLHYCQHYQDCEIEGPHHDDDSTAQVTSNPFAFVSLSNLLRKSGLLDDDRDNSTKNNIREETHSKQSTSASDKVPCTGKKQIEKFSHAKTSFLAILSVLNTVKNRRVLYFILTALLHPLAPASSGGNVTKLRPNVLSNEDKKIRVRLDPSPSSTNSDSDFQDIISSFAKIHKDLYQNKIEGIKSNSNENKCIFSLSPALASILEIGDVGSTSLFHNEFKVDLRPNPYRRVLLACLSGTGGMAILQGDAVHILDAAVSALDGHSINNILFGVGERIRQSKAESSKSDETVTEAEQQLVDIFSVDGMLSRCSVKQKNFDDIVSVSSNISEVIASLCVSVMTASACLNVWRLHYNSTAAHALLVIVTSYNFALQKATKLMEHRRRQSSSFLADLPSIIVTEFFDSLHDHATSLDRLDNDHSNVTMDRIFRDSFDASDQCVVNNLEYDRDQETFQLGISKKTSLSDSISTFINDRLHSVLPNKSVPDDEEENCLLRCAARNVFAHLQLDALVTLLNKGTSGNKVNMNFDQITTAPSGSSSERSGKIPDQVFASLPARMNKALTDEQHDHPSSLSSSSSENDHHQTTTAVGTVMSLSGRTAFPCVCEVTRESAHLFRDANSSVVADGVRWQSLYLVVVGRRAVLAEPERTDEVSGGRIVASCFLSCLSVLKDEPEETRRNPSPARRLRLTHASLRSVPGLFKPVVAEDNNKKQGRKPGKGDNLIVSKMNLWFEDEVAASAAYQALIVKVWKARARRGKHLMSAIFRDDDFHK